MNGKGLLVVLGIVLLVAMFFGSRMIIDNAPAGGSKDKNEQLRAAGPPEWVICWGYFVSEAGVANMYPKQSGDVVDVKPEMTRVKKGEVILQLDDRVMQLKVKQADAAVKVAEQVLEEAKKLPGLYESQIKQQQASITGVGFEKKKLEAERDSRLNGIDKDSKLFQTVTDLYDFGLKQLDEKKKAEEAKLDQIKMQDAQSKIIQAEQDLIAKQLQRDEAKEMLRHFRLEAPSDGTVLRVNVNKGETLGPMPRIHALDFLPDSKMIVRAEVLQEWGRFVEEGRTVEIEDDTYKGPVWEGKVKKVVNYYDKVRNPVIEPFRYNDVRTLEFTVELPKGAEGAKIGQRVRARVKVAS